MSFLHLSLISIGGFFVALPVLLHLLMRRKPRRILFPAIRFVRLKRQLNQQRLRLRHLLLLLLRCLAIIGLAAALARPFVPSNELGNWLLLLGIALTASLVGGLAVASWIARHHTGLTATLTLITLTLVAALVLWALRMQTHPAAPLLADREAPVAAVLVVDVAPRMALRHHSHTRLGQAQELARWLIGQLPADSDVAVFDTASLRSTFAVDPQAAKTTIDALRIAYQVQPLPLAMEVGLELLKTSAKKRKEMYVFTDMTDGSWDASTATDLPQQMASGPPVLLYLIDVGTKRPTNASLGLPQLSGEYVVQGNSLDVEFPLAVTGAATGLQAELLLEKPDPSRPVIVDGQSLLPELSVRDRTTVLPPMEDESVGLSFTLRGLSPGTHHGQIRLTPDDGLAIDNRRFFSIQVMEPRRVLIAASGDVAAEYVTAALAPYETEHTGRSYFACRSVPFDQWEALELSNFAAIGLLDPPPLADAAWRKLTTYVENGGGLAIFLGRNAQPIEHFNEGPAQLLLPGQLHRHWRAGARRVYLTTSSLSHPILDVLNTRATTIPWNNFPIYEHWVLHATKEGAVTIMRYGNGLPAIIEAKLGKGRILTVTTPVTDPLNVPGRDPWNLLPTGPDPWPYFVLVNEMFRHLVQGGQTKLNYHIGDTATLPFPTVTRGERVQLFTPDGQWQDVSTQTPQVTYPFTRFPGTYRLLSQATKGTNAGFSVNLPETATMLTRVGQQQLEQLLGKDQFRVAREREEINRTIGEARAGREFFPWLMVFLVVVLGLEHLLANRFYASEAPA